MSSEATSATPMPAGAGQAVPLEISVTDLRALRDTAAAHALLDVREAWELEICRLSDARHLPMAQVPERVAELPRDELLVVLCHHGVRSERVTAWLRANGFSLATNLAGGIDAWAQVVEPGLARY